MTQPDAATPAGSTGAARPQQGAGGVELLAGRSAEVGGLTLQRLLPQRGRRSIGAWCFADHAGPVALGADAAGMQVPPHPHIGLQTFTWMICGEVLHRDSLGHRQVIRPGELNLMTAGRGIAHAEQSVAGSGALHAAQLWIALPAAQRAVEPRFDHHAELPRWREAGVECTLLAGECGGLRAPTRVYSPLLALELRSPGGGRIRLPADRGFEYGAMLLEGRVEVQGTPLTGRQLACLGAARDRIELQLEAGARVLLLGGEPLGEQLLMWWNFVGREREEITEARRQWEAGSPRFGEVPGFGGHRLPAPPLPWRV